MGIKQWLNVKEFSDITKESISDIFTGNLFTKEIIKKQIPLMLLLVFFIICHIGLRYACEKKIIEIENADKRLTDVKYDALTRSSALLEMHKQSRIIDIVEETDASLKPSKKPAVIISQK